MRFFPREKGGTALCQRKTLDKGRFPFSRGKNRISQGVENRGSLISVPLALREQNPQKIPGQSLENLGFLRRHPLLADPCLKLLILAKTWLQTEIPSKDFWAWGVKI